MEKYNGYFVFDVESHGLNGDGFAFGYQIVNPDLTMGESGFFTSGLELEKANRNDIVWLSKNIPEEILTPTSGGAYVSEHELREYFSRLVKEASEKGMGLVTDCGFPVETNFLKTCFVSAYPLFDVSTALLMVGKDPIGTYDRLENELPKHHPMMDARQSARIWIECLKMARVEKV